MSFTRGFGGRRPSPETAGRLPPGQHLVSDFPVLSAGPTQRIRPEEWTFTLKAGPKPIKAWDWTAFNALPKTKITKDIHCVTTWSKFDTLWEGVSFDDILADAGIAAPTPYVLAHSYGGYSTNVPVADLAGGKAMVALAYDGKPISADHGGPARLLVPHLYFWKSAKWVNALQFTPRDEAGFWETHGYNMYGDPCASSVSRVTDAAPPAVAAVPWQTATVTDIVQRTPHIKSFFFRLPQPFAFRAGQHVDVRLTAPDGYRAMRSYSIASAPEDSTRLELAIELMDNGEVSPFFHDVVAVGDAIDLRGPLGGYFIWSIADGGPLLLVGGGSGVVPLTAMVRHRAAAAARVPVVLLCSARTWDDVLYRDELIALDERRDGFTFLLALTREKPRRAADYARRVDAAMIAEALAKLPGPAKNAYVCGSNAFADAAADGAVSVGIPPGDVRTERYGG